MKSTKLLSSILALLGFQLQSCDVFEGTDAYGCPYTTFKSSGTVKDSLGNRIKDAKVSVKIDAVVTKEDSTGVTKDTIWTSKGSSRTNRKGEYEVRQSGEERYYNDPTLNFEIITENDGYKSDTTHKEFKIQELKAKEGDEWETLRCQETNVVLKRK